MKIPRVYYEKTLPMPLTVRGFDEFPNGITARSFRLALAANCLYELMKVTDKDRREKMRIAALDKQFQNGRDYTSETPTRVAELGALQGWC